MPYSTRRKKNTIISADAWVKILRSLDDQVDDLAININNMAKHVLNTANEILLFNGDWNRYKVEIKELNKIRENSVFAGVDSSLTPPIRLGPYLFSAVSAAAIITRGMAKNPTKIIDASFERAPEVSDAGNAYHEIKMKMFEKEVEMLGKCMAQISRMYNENVDKIIFMDGPIVDPPIFSKGSQSLHDSYENLYVKNRATTILEGIKQNIWTIGIVKKIEGNLLASTLTFSSDKSNEISHLLNDHTLITFIFKSSYLTEILRKSIVDDNKDIVLVTKAFELSKNTDYPIYRRYNLFVYSFYILPGLRSPKKKVFRVEIPFDHEPSEQELEEHVWKWAKYVVAASLPGYGIPIPVIFAHKACTIPRRTARKVMKETVSRFLTTSLKKRTTFGIIGAIDLVQGLVE
jgi:hypothetical protein